MKDYHGIIFAYNAQPELRGLVASRTAASLPFCGRYRLIDFSLSAMRNAGILDVGVIMQRDYQSLLDHLGSGKSWDMSRRTGGMRMLPPFGLPEYHRGNYNGTMEALNAVSTYVKDIKAKYVVLMLGNMCANIDLTAAMKQHRSSGADITAICSDTFADGCRMCYSVGKDGFVDEMLIDSSPDEKHFASLEAYIVNRDVLLDLMEASHRQGLYRFHKDALSMWLKNGGRMGMYVHSGYATIVRTVEGYYKANMDTLNIGIRRSLFPVSLPIYTRVREEVSTYYGENAVSKNCLVADNCIIEGEMENCIVFSGARIAKGAILKNCIVMRGAEVGEHTYLDHVIADKFSSFSADTNLIGNEKLPVVVPKGSKL